MAFGDLSPRTDEAGIWVTIPYDGVPAVKLFFAADPEPQVPQPISLFWQGWGNPEIVCDFLGTLHRSWGELRVIDETGEDEAVLSSEHLGVGSLRFPNGRIFIGIAASEGKERRLDLWCDGIEPAHGLTREVGVAMNAGILLEHDMFSACSTLIERTVRWQELRPREVEELTRLIRRRIVSHYPSLIPAR